MSSTMTDEDRRVLELQKRREANIRKKEQQRIEAEALEEQKQKHFLELEKQRQAVISQKEEEWAVKEEAQRKKDEATILYIREARERRYSHLTLQPPYLFQTFLAGARKKKRKS